MAVAGNASTEPAGDDGDLDGRVRDHRHGRPRSRRARPGDVLVEPPRWRRVDSTALGGRAARGGREPRGHQRSGLRACRRPARRHRPVRCRVLRHQPARRGGVRSAAPALPRVRLEGVRGRGLRRRARSKVRSACSPRAGSASTCSRTCSRTSTWRRRSASGSCATPATTPTSSRRACPTSSTSTGRASTCRRRAARRSSPSTSPARACSVASATSPWSAAPSSPPCSTGATSTRRARSCRPTDTAAPSMPRSAGTVISSACGAVLLKPLADALEDGDNVLAVVRGSAINNDGHTKVGYLAPSLPGQAQVVTEALAIAGVDPRDVTYVEAHGTGTLIGDPIEVTGLSQAYRLSTDDRQFCAIGSLKSNIGHTGEAAGIMSLIKTVLALQHREIPPSLHFEEPNPQADFPNSPFFVNATLRPWEPGPGGTRLAGITGLGAGGTNAHVIIEEAPPREPSSPTRAAQLVTISARSADAARQAAAELATHLRAHPDLDLADVAFTRLVGRKPFAMRRAIVATSTEEAAELLDAPFSAGRREPPPRRAAVGGLHAARWWCPIRRHGTRAVRGGAGLSGGHRCLRGGAAQLRDGIDLRAELYGDKRCRRRQPEARGAVPRAPCPLRHGGGDGAPARVVGHHAGGDDRPQRGRVRRGVLVGRRVARGRPGARRAAGPPVRDPAARRHAQRAAERGGAARAAPFWGEHRRCQRARALRRIRTRVAHRRVGGDPRRPRRRQRPHPHRRRRPLRRCSSRSSTTSPRPAGGPRFTRPRSRTSRTSRARGSAPPMSPTPTTGCATCATRCVSATASTRSSPTPTACSSRWDPGRTLTSLARMAPVRPAAVTPTMRHAKESGSDVVTALSAIARAWEAGVAIDPGALHGDEQRHRVALPTYPFEHQRYWVEPDVAGAPRATAKGVMRKRAALEEWFAAPVVAPGAPQAARRPGGHEPGGDHRRRPPARHGARPPARAWPSRRVRQAR